MLRIRALDPKINICNVGPHTLPNYKNEYRLIRHPRKGYAFIEVYYGHGLGGFQKTIRDCVIRAAGLGFDVVVDPEPVPARPAAPFFFNADRCRMYAGYKLHPDWFDGAPITFPRRAIA